MRFRSRLLGVVLTLLVAAVAPALADETPLSERTMGNPSAPVTLIEYSSMTCPHCAAFHDEVLPKLRANYIDTGKVLYIFRDFPLDGRAAAAAMVARCVPPSNYFGFVALLYRDQKTWARSDDPLGELAQRARLVNLSQTDFDACLKDEALLKSIQERARQGEETFGIEATPTFIINGTQIRGAESYERFQSVIEDALAAAEKAGKTGEAAPAPAAGDGHGDDTGSGATAPQGATGQ